MDVCAEPCSLAQRVAAARCGTVVRTHAGARSATHRVARPLPKSSARQGRHGAHRRARVDPGRQRSPREAGYRRGMAHAAQCKIVLREPSRSRSMSRVAVIGNTARAIGAVCASDLALSGHEVRFTVFPEQGDQLPAVRAAGGFNVEGDPKHLISRKTGFAKLARVCDTTAEALENAEAVLIEVDMHQLEAKFGRMISEFARGAVVHVQSHGYWAAARLTPLLRKAGRDDVLATEAPAPTHA